MLAILARNWWSVALRGLFAVLFGAFALAAAIVGRAQGSLWWALLAEGLFGIAAGILTFLWPGLTDLALLFLIAAWAIATGVLEITAAIRLRKEIEGEWLLALSGVLSVGLGIALVVMPGPGILALIWLIGAYAILFGIVLLILAFKLRALAWRLPPIGAREGGMA